MKIAGLLLAGGASLRFGREKAVAECGEGMLLDAPMQALIGACDQVAVSAREGSGAAKLAIQTSFDLLPDPPNASAGPLWGVLSGLIWAAEWGADILVTAPCDAASLAADDLDRLIETTAREGYMAVARSPLGLEPLVAAWPVSPSLTALREHLRNGHPAAKDVIGTLGFTPVDGFDGVNINAPADLYIFNARSGGAEIAEHGRLFAFENDFVRTLRCIPMCVRFKLDRAGVKLSLRQWSRFTLTDRQTLRSLPCNAAPEVASYRSALVGLIQARSTEPVKELPPSPRPAWDLSDVPAEILAFARQRRFCTPSPQDWSRLTTLERYALVKLSRDKHENANFEPALREFGVLDHAADHRSR